MKKLVGALIHFLGGLTPEDNRISNEHCLQCGALKAYQNVKAIADSMYGYDWRERVYTYVTHCINDIDETQTSIQK